MTDRDELARLIDEMSEGWWTSGDIADAIIAKGWQRCGPHCRAPGLCLQPEHARISDALDSDDTA